MIEGTFDDVGHIFFEIDLIAADGLKLPVDAILDTGFTGFLVINKQYLDALEWVYRGDEQMLTARGEAIFERYLGKVALDGQEYEIPIYAGD